MRARRPSGPCPPPEVDPRDARLELARRYLHVFGPATPEAFAEWAGIGARHGRAAFDALGEVADPGAHPDRRRVDPHAATSRRSAPPRRPRRPHGSSRAATPTSSSRDADRELLVPDADRRRELWTSRVWPGAVLVEGEVVGTWRRAQGTDDGPGLAPSLARGTRCGRGGSGSLCRCPVFKGGSSSAGTDALRRSNGAGPGGRRPGNDRSSFRNGSPGTQPWGRQRGPINRGRRPTTLRIPHDMPVITPSMSCSATTGGHPQEQDGKGPPRGWPALPSPS